MPAHPSSVIVRVRTSTVWRTDGDNPFDGAIRMKEEGRRKPLSFYIVSFHLFKWFIAEYAPKLFAALDRLHSRDQSAHTVADQHHLIQYWVARTRVERSPQLKKIASHLRRAYPKRLARRILIEPKLVIAAELLKGTQVVEHGHPRKWTRPKAMHHNHWDSIWIIRL